MTEQEIYAKMRELRDKKRNLLLAYQEGCREIDHGYREAILLQKKTRDNDLYELKRNYLENKDSLSVLMEDLYDQLRQMHREEQERAESVAE